MKVARADDAMDCSMGGPRSFVRLRSCRFISFQTWQSITAVAGGTPHGPEDPSGLSLSAWEPTQGLYGAPGVQSKIVHGFMNMFMNP